MIRLEYFWFVLLKDKKMLNKKEQYPYYNLQDIGQFPKQLTHLTVLPKRLNSISQVPDEEHICSLTLQSDAVNMLRT
jgi:hypothetical protein